MDRHALARVHSHSTVLVGGSAVVRTFHDRAAPWSGGHRAHHSYLRARWHAPHSHASRLLWRTDHFTTASRPVPLPAAARRPIRTRARRPGGARSTGWKSSRDSHAQPAR